MTLDTITSGFRATGIVPLNPDQVLLDLKLIIESTTSPQSSQSSWDPKTPNTLPEIKK
ncbi:hypothetical protein M433DRAFT_155823 [Acidomyces richmondensis BFW]|nr:hypothetical protein M433DRAFT_155823 [Acidomyces richmondensis BFW]